MVEAAARQENHGVELRHGRIVGLLESRERVAGVRLEDGSTLAADLVLVAAGVLAADGDYAQWRGPKRDGISPDTGLLKHWPEGGPKLL